MPLYTRLLVITFLLISTAAFCRANLNETEAQCIARYGPEISVKTDLGYRQVGDKKVSFTKKTANGSLDISVIFLNGLSCHESFANSDLSQGLSQDQMKAILDSQNAGLNWDRKRKTYRTTAGTTYGTIDWERSDGAVARFYVSSPASSQTQTGQVDLSTQQYASTQSFYNKQNGD